ncbi:hypothetical protein K7432_010323 [Basidiobolus ranarum]|uniref:Thaumatin-like protein n=1 Tax=Basidiobolus ranarum TaxID=34480 RepID=A0ABR2WNY5_9FUNG
MLSVSSIITCFLLALSSVRSAPVDQVRTTHTSTVQFINKCSQKVWLAALSDWQNSPLPPNGGLLQSGDSYTLTVIDGWQGRFWGRTECDFLHKDVKTNTACATGDCGSGEEYCQKLSGQPPATLVEFKFNGWNNLDYYDISLVGGYNLPISIQTHSTMGLSSNDPYRCTGPAIKEDINLVCPLALRQYNSKGQVVGCKSACDAFGTPEYCCTGAHSTPQTCNASDFSKVFKTACPGCYSYTYDDATSTYTCSGDYTIQFC